MKDGGHIYVCGDVKMADDVMKTLCDIISGSKHVSVQKAKETVKQLKVRYYLTIFMILSKL